MTSETFDIAVIGGGPGGYPAAIKAAQNGKKVALIEATGLGGTCLNRGCIPSKSLIAGAQLLNRMKEAHRFGIQIEGYSFNYAELAKQKDKVVSRMRKGLEGLIASNKITLFEGYGKFLSPTTIKVTGKDQAEITASKIIIATGSEPLVIPNLKPDGEKIHDSTSLLNITSLPKKIVIIGGGVIGCEFASLFRAFDVKVTIIEALDSILPTEAVSVSSEMTRVFKKKGIEILTHTFVEKIDNDGEGIKIQIAGGKTIDSDIALVSIGRKLNTDNINLERAGVLIDEKTGLISVNDQMETNVPGIYAIGDIASKWWLAHVASHQGLIAGNNASGLPLQKMHYNAVPCVIFTEPEIGTVGYTLERAIEEGYNATVGAFPFSALGKSQATYQTEGFAQIVTDRKTGQVLGAQVVGHDAGTLVAEMAVVIANEMTVECISHTIHAHPTVAEAWLEAALQVQQTPLHLPPKK
ncbi:MAG: dihydrolipoyl dehydrogenase [Waddliaceae bacterium]